MKRQTLVAALAACLLSLASAADSRAQGEEVRLDAERQKITTASFVRARGGPQFAAPEVARLKLGTVLTAAARSAEESEIGGRRDYWYRVGLPAGGTGWVFGGLLADYDPARRREIVRRIIDERLKVESMSFEDGVDLYDFVSAELADAREPADRGELERLRLQALNRAAMGIPDNEHARPPYRDFHRAHAADIYHHELAGGWYVRPERFWELERKYTGTAAGDRIAWDAAQALRPGECEGDEVCNFLSLVETDGKYLSLYPNGAHASEVLQNFERALASDDMAQTLNSRGGDQYQDEARAALRKALTELRAAVAKTSAPEKAAVVKLLDRLSPAGR